MKRIMLGIATCAIALSGCSLNEEIASPSAVGQSDGSIRFGVNTPVTRAANLWDNDTFTKTGREFNVVGLSGETEYLGTFDAPRTVKFDGTEWSYDNKLYWPTTSLTFFSWYLADNGTSALNEGLKPSKESATVMKFTDYKVNTDISKQEDFLVGAGTYNKEELSTIHFKHALTKVLFKAEVVPGSQLKVTIDDVMICNLKDKGTLTVTAQTDVTKAAAPGMEWTALGMQANGATSYAKYETGTFTDKVTMTAPAANGTTTASYLPGDNGKPVPGSTMLLMPQEFKAWEPLTQKIADGTTGALLTDADSPLLISKSMGAFIGVKCTIEGLNTNNESFGAGKEVYLHGGADTKWLYIPVSSVADMYGQWRANRAITYVITFGDAGSGSGGGGWTGDDGDGDGKIDPVLVPINFKVNVSDWDEFEVILQSVNFNRTGLNNQTAPTELKNLADMLITEAANNPQKKYAAKFDLTYDNNSDDAKLDLSTSDLFAKFKDNDKFQAGSTIAIKVTSGKWDTDGIKFPTIDGWDISANQLTANGTITYTKTAIAKVERQRIGAMANNAVMKIYGEVNEDNTWDYSTDAAAIAFRDGLNDGIVLQFAEFTSDKVITMKIKPTSAPSDHLIGVGSSIDAARTAADSNTTGIVKVNKSNSFVVIKLKK